LAVFLLAVPGLLLALVLIALPLYYLTALSLPEAFLLAAILSPTDPVAVLGLFRQLNVHADLSMIVEGESLFNDGVAGVVYQIFLALVLVALQGQTLSLGQTIGQSLWILLLQAGGGVLTGLVCGWLMSRFMARVTDHLIVITISLVTAYGVYLLADSLHFSGILAVIIAALIMGNYSRDHGLSEQVQSVVDDFWGVIAFLANAMLFLLVGGQLDPQELFTVRQPVPLIVVALLAIIAVLVARFVMVLVLPRRLSAIPGLRLRSWRFIIFLSGLRGALSLALVLALPLNVPNRSLLLIATYSVVFFTLLVQGFGVQHSLRLLPRVRETKKDLGAVDS
jgi:CPA1 family monovalent cation:H+ antiporter